MTNNVVIAQYQPANDTWSFVGASLTGLLFIALFSHLSWLGQMFMFCLAFASTAFLLHSRFEQRKKNEYNAYLMRFNWSDLVQLLQGEDALSMSSMTSERVKLNLLQRARTIQEKRLVVDLMTDFEMNSAREAGLLG